MGLIDSIRAACRTVVMASGLGEAWYYRQITSPPSAQTAKTYSAWIATAGVFTSLVTSDEVDQKTGRFVRRERAGLRLPDTVALRDGDQVSQTKADDTAWAVDGRGSGGSGEGTIRYVLKRETPLLGTADRGGGV